MPRGISPRPYTMASGAIRYPQPSSSAVRKGTGPAETGISCTTLSVGRGRPKRKRWIIGDLLVASLPSPSRLSACHLSQSERFCQRPHLRGGCRAKARLGSGLLIFFILPRTTLQNKRQNRHFFATKPAERSQSIKISAAGGGCNCKFRPILLYWNCYFESENGGNPCIAMESSACWRWCCRCAA